jgi:hypothetical protein
MRSRSDSLSLSSRAGLSLRRGSLPTDLRLLSDPGLSLSRECSLGAAATLHFTLLGSSFAFVRGPLALVGSALPRVRDPLALVGGALPHVRYPLALVRGPLTLRQVLSSLLERVGKLLAPQGEPLTLLGKLLPLLGGVLARGCNSLAFPSQPKRLVQPIRWFL